VTVLATIEQLSGHLIFSLIINVLQKILLPAVEQV
jgi:hypothetical protein